MNAMHTPTPWFVSDFDYTTVYAHVDDDAGDGHKEPGICSCDGEEIAKIEDRDVRRANAAFIVKACNAHDDLVAALRGMLNARGPQSEQAWAILEHDARAALAKAGAAS